MKTFVRPHRAEFTTLGAANRPPSKARR